MSIHIAHVTTVHPLTDNRILRKECRAGVKYGFRVTLIGPGSPIDGSSIIEPGVDVVRTKFAPGRVRRAVIGSVRIYRELRRLSPDLVHGHDPELLPALLLYRVLNPKKAVSYDAHEKLAGQIAGKPYIPRLLVPLVSSLSVRAVGVLTRGLHGVVCATSPIAETISNERTCVVQNFPWLDDLPASERQSTDGEFVACYVGAISEERGLSAMIAAVRRSTLCNRLLLAGPATPFAQSIIDQNRDIVDFRGRVDPARVPELIAESAVGLAVLRSIPNYVDSQPTKVFEYMAAGVPFIVSDFEYWQKLFGACECGFFVDSESVQDIAESIDTLARDRERAVQMGANGQAAFESCFNFETQAKLLAEFHHALAQPRHARVR
ncbi:glycosyltransferase involved in cell wall biosynthesis [Dietzia kunjamensis]|uniref:glycosyltransferase n=1 Tax=Dietzia kunjamensis TaxID=322509 RepID=UPI000E742631|nr:glycosyltransferase [Dietzia kunjamensis]RKE59502.1 glycosyltransferase involved in cell wall biosynthesis [Dietzia kunjamensis]